MDENDIPVLTDAVSKAVKKAEVSSDAVDLRELRREIVNASHELLDERLREVAKELQSMLSNELVVTMKSELPALIDQILARHLEKSDDRQDD